LLSISKFNLIDNILFLNEFICVFFIGDDAAKVKWVRLDRNHKLYASHEQIIRAVIKKHGAYEY
jgi:hypothetical protein